jgi:hypothetical protein
LNLLKRKASQKSLPFAGNSNRQRGIHVAGDKKKNKSKSKNNLNSSSNLKGQHDFSSGGIKKESFSHEVRTNDPKAEMCLFPPFGGNAGRQRGITRSRR